MKNINHEEENNEKVKRIVRKAAHLCRCQLMPESYLTAMNYEDISLSKEETCWATELFVGSGAGTIVGVGD